MSLEDRKLILLILSSEDQKEMKSYRRHFTEGDCFTPGTVIGEKALKSKPDTCAAKSVRL